MTVSENILEFVERLGRWGAAYKPRDIAIFCLVLVLLIGIADYSAGKYVSLSIAYVLPIWIAAWYVGAPYAFFLSLLSVVIWIYGDAATGLTFPDFFVPMWNATIRLMFYVFLIALLQRLRTLQHTLASRVEERAAALTREIAERQRLERDLLDVSEREQRRIGQDLHDGLCQHLTGTAIAGHVLAEKLALEGHPETDDAGRIVDHIETAIGMARGMAKGLHPVERGSDGLMQALEEFAAATSEMFGISCLFECDSPVLVHDQAVATNLYRIAQEAVSNAIKHGRAKQIVVALENAESGLKLTIADSGTGLPEVLPSNHGMGMRIMANRASVIGADFLTRRSVYGGAEIACTMIAGSEVIGVAHG
ncbi:MAG TPA: ATP-binding protein [Rhizomicrobium sp.]|nr:ATP-binding protein [Rhizomicrobium sp.]